MAGRCPFPHELFTRRPKTDEPTSPQRRALFKGAAFAGGMALLGGVSARSAYAAVPVFTAAGTVAAGASASGSEARDSARNGTSHQKL